jgi:hypothetical protein
LTYIDQCYFVHYLVTPSHQNIPKAAGELCIKEEAIFMREGEAVKLSSPAAEDTTT